MRVHSSRTSCCLSLCSLPKRIVQTACSFSRLFWLACQERTPPGKIIPINPEDRPPGHPHFYGFLVTEATEAGIKCTRIFNLTLSFGIPQVMSGCSSDLFLELQKKYLNT